MRGYTADRLSGLSWDRSGLELECIRATEKNGKVLISEAEHDRNKNKETNK